MGRPPERKDRGCSFCPSALSCPFFLCPEEEQEQAKREAILLNQPVQKSTSLFSRKPT